MKTYTALFKFGFGLYDDPIKVEVLEADAEGTLSFEIEPGSLPYYGNSELVRAVAAQLLVWGRVNGFPHGDRVLYETNHEGGRNWLVMEIDFDSTVITCAPDCVERTACSDAGKPGHTWCGHCDKCNRPAHHCGHLPAPIPAHDK